MISFTGGGIPKDPVSISDFGVCSVLVAQPVVDFDFRLDLAVAIALLQDTGELFGFAAQSGEIVVGELAPLLSHLALEFMPLAGQDPWLSKSAPP